MSGAKPKQKKWRDVFPGAPADLYISKGSYGMVYQGKNDTVEKVFFKQKWFTCDFLNNIPELAAGTSLSGYKNLVSTIEIKDAPDMEYNDSLIYPEVLCMNKYDCSLSHWIQYKWEAKYLLEIAKGITSGLHWMHYNRWLHRDIKPSNVFMKDKIPYLGDFGMVQYMSNQVGVSSKCLHRDYSPPEVVMGLNASVKSDIWALGCTIYALITKEYFIQKVTKSIPNTSDQLYAIFRRTPSCKLVPAYLRNVLDEKKIKALRRPAFYLNAKYKSQFVHVDLVDNCLCGMLDLNHNVRATTEMLLSHQIFSTSMLHKHRQYHEGSSSSSKSFDMFSTPSTYSFSSSIDDSHNTHSTHSTTEESGQSASVPSSVKHLKHHEGPYALLEEGKRDKTLTCWQCRGRNIAMAVITSLFNKTTRHFAFSARTALTAVEYMDKYLFVMAYWKKDYQTNDKVEAFPMAYMAHYLEQSCPRKPTHPRPRRISMRSGGLQTSPSSSLSNGSSTKRSFSASLFKIQRAKYLIRRSERTNTHRVMKTAKGMDNLFQLHNQNYANRSSSSTVMNTREVGQKYLPLLHKEKALKHYRLMGLVCAYLALKIHHNDDTLPTWKQLNLIKLKVTYEEWAHMEMFLCKNVFRWNLDSYTLVDEADRLGIKLTNDDDKYLLTIMQSRLLKNGSKTLDIIKYYLDTKKKLENVMFSQLKSF